MITDYMVCRISGDSRWYTDLSNGRCLERHREYESLAQWFRLWHYYTGCMDIQHAATNTGAQRTTMLSL